MLGEYFTTYPDIVPLPLPAGGQDSGGIGADPDGTLHYHVGFDYCNSRIQCFQCTDCLLPENPKVLKLNC
jgi:hypothetical protein